MCEEEEGWTVLGSLTCQEEGDEAGLFGHVEFEAGAAEHVLHHGLGAPGTLQEGQELLGLLSVLQSEGEDSNTRVMDSCLRSPYRSST